MFAIQQHPIDLTEALREIRSDECGGHVIFEGRVRNHHEGCRVDSLRYEAYLELAEKEGRRLVEAVARKHRVRAAAVHAVGTLKPGELAVWVGTSGHHREEAFLACRELIDSIKERVPIWKREFREGGPGEWIEGCGCGSPRT
jgi:molybdopterin synthase catalytic subunit